MSEDICRVAGCVSPISVKKRRLCRKHYHRAWSSKKLDDVAIWRHSVISYLEGDMVGTCTECGPGVRVFMRNGRANCWKSARQSTTSWRHGISRQVLDDRVAAVDNRCEICKVRFADDQPYCVDHDHACCPGTQSCGKCIRGFLCRTCNIGLGVLGDDPDRIESAAEYLRRVRLENLPNTDTPGELENLPNTTGPVDFKNLSNTTGQVDFQNLPIMTAPRTPAARG